MNPQPPLLVAGLLAVVAGCTTVQVGRAPVKAATHFTIAHLEASQVDIPAAPTQVVPPRPRVRYPGDGPDGYAIVEFIVDADGIPREVQWLEASDELFASLAVTSVAESRYRPAQKGGRAVAMKMETRIAYHSPRIPAVSPAGSRYDDHSAAGIQNRYDDSGIFVSNYYQQ